MTDTQWAPPPDASTAPTAPPPPSLWSRIANSRVGLFISGGTLVVGSAAIAAPVAFNAGKTAGSNNLTAVVLKDGKAGDSLRAYVASQMTDAVLSSEQFDNSQQPSILAAISADAVTTSAESNRVFYVHLDDHVDGAAISYSPTDGVNLLPSGAIRAADDAWNGQYGAAVAVSDAGIRTSFGNGTGYLVLPNGAGPDREKATFISASTDSHLNMQVPGITAQ